MNSGFRPGLFCRHKKKKKTEDVGQERTGDTSHVQQDSNMTQDSEVNMMMTVPPTSTTTSGQQSSSSNLPLVSGHLHSLSSTPQTTSVSYHHEKPRRPTIE